MAYEIKTRNRTLCVCGRMNHKKCQECGTTHLIGTKGVPGLFDHITGTLHECDGGYSTMEDEDYENSGTTPNKSDKAGKSEGAASPYGGVEVETTEFEELEFTFVGGMPSNSGNGEGDEVENSEPLSGQKVAATGKMGMTRNEVKAAIEALGGQLVERIDSSTSMLIVGDLSKVGGTTVKTQTAGNLGTKTMTEEEFMEMMEANGVGEPVAGSGGSNTQDGEGDGEPPLNEEDKSLIEALVEQLKPYGEDISGINRKQLNDTIIDLKRTLNNNVEKRMTELEEKVTAEKVTTIEIIKPDLSTVTVKGTHNQTPDLLRLMAAREPVMLVGPAGSGKTEGARLAAEALSMRFFPKSVGPTTTVFEMFGYNDANGNFQPGIMYEPFVRGGVLLLDEIDSGNPACLTALNTALANDYCSFPNGVEKKHEDFIVIASGNTFGRGADRQYVGRTQMDEATRNRFSFMPWDYDKALEIDIAKGLAAASNNSDVMTWCYRVHAIREAIEETKERMVAGTRDIVKGANLIIHGFSLQEVEDLRFWNGADTDLTKKIKAKVSATK